MKSNHPHGFTLVEVLIGLVIIVCALGVGYGCLLESTKTVTNINEKIQVHLVAMEQLNLAELNSSVENLNDITETVHRFHTTWHSHVSFEKLDAHIIKVKAQIKNVSNHKVSTQLTGFAYVESKKE